MVITAVLVVILRFAFPAEITSCATNLVSKMATGMNVDSTAYAAAQPIPTPSMVAERPVGEVPAGARAYFQPLLKEAMNKMKDEFRTEIGIEFDKSMNTNFASLNKAMEDSRTLIKQYVDGSSVELIAKFDNILNAKSVEIDKK